MFAKTACNDICLIACITDCVEQSFFPDFFSILRGEAQRIDLVGAVLQGKIDDLAGKTEVIDDDDDGVIYGIAVDFVLMAALIIIGGMKRVVACLDAFFRYAKSGQGILDSRSSFSIFLLCLLCIA